MKKIIIVIAVLVLFASCQSPVLSYNSSEARYVEYEVPELTATVQIIIE